MKIALDLMGSDHPLEVTLAAARRAVTRIDNLELLLVGDQAVV
ncbi:MAG: phosphate acyltransferase, partial [Gammaproteobacteria bacterium]|nr:phosphate acyltransferase [Gammaproteobacteria bacterium]